MPFRVALTGLRAASADLKVTGNNIANSSTVGFKQSRTEFVDVYAASSGSIASVTAGSGVRVAEIRQVFSQGNIDYTDNSTDLAITGDGFFVVKDNQGQYFTRAGAFGLDREGFVTNATGQKLQVFEPVTVGDQTTFNTGKLVDLKLNSDIGAPQETTSVSADLNLDADVAPFIVVGAATDVATTPFVASDPTTYHHVTSTTVYDSLGAPHVATTYYRKVDTALGGGAFPNAWQTFYFVKGQQVNPLGTAANTPGVLEFNPDGTLDTVTPPGLTNPNELPYAPFNPGTGANNINLGYNYGDTTQFGSDFSVNALTQNGFSTGMLSGFDVSENGTVYARYTNGNAEVLGMVALANFANPQGLGVSGDNLWVESNAAGDLVLGQPGSSSLGLIQSGALESSNVEVADQLINLIVAQRNYQANAEVISTADTITQTLINIR